MNAPWYIVHKYYTGSPHGLTLKCNCKNKKQKDVEHKIILYYTIKPFRPQTITDRAVNETHIIHLVRFRRKLKNTPGLKHVNLLKP